MNLNDFNFDEVTSNPLSSNFSKLHTSHGILKQLGSLSKLSFALPPCICAMFNRILRTQFYYHPHSLLRSADTL